MEDKKDSKPDSLAERLNRIKEQMIKDQEKENVMEFISSVLNTEYEYQTLKYKAYHIPYIDIPNKYKNYRISTFIFYYQLDCLFENGLIDENTKAKLNELYSYYLELDNKLRDYVTMENDAYRRKEALEERNLGHNDLDCQLLLCSNGTHLGHGADIGEESDTRGPVCYTVAIRLAGTAYLSGKVLLTG